MALQQIIGTKNKVYHVRKCEEKAIQHVLRCLERNQRLAAFRSTKQVFDHDTQSLTNVFSFKMSFPNLKSNFRMTLKYGFG